MGQILAIVSSKGGVGKTTTAVNLAAAFASLDFSTLLVEADPQCGLGACFGYDRFDLPRGLAEVIAGRSRLEETTFETTVGGLHIVSSNVWSQEEEAAYLGAIEKDPGALRHAVRSLNGGYDYIILDAPPMLGPITMAVLSAADRYIIPASTEPNAIRSLSRLIEAADGLRARCNPGLQFDGVALTMFDGRTRMSAAIADQVRALYPERVFASFIPRSVRLAEVPASGRPLVVSSPASRGAQAYAALAEEILSRHARERVSERADREPAVADTTPDAPPAEGEWDDRFVDLETFLEMESGEQSKAAVADEDNWEEIWER